VKHSHQHGTVAAAVAEEDHPVAAVQSGRSRGGAPKGRGQRFLRSRGGRRPASAAAANPEPDTPSKVARSATGLCFYHWTYGKQAHKCEPPCSWSTFRINCQSSII
jgi:hypothetical protein